MIGADNSFAHYALNGSRAIHNELVANAICTELTVDTTGGHGIFRNASSKFRAQRVSCFFKSVFCSNCTHFYTTDSIPSTCSVPLSIAENGPGSQIKVYPNPFENAFRIEWIEGELDLSIYNTLGQLVYRDEIVNGEVRVDLPSGIYFLNVQQVETNLAVTAKVIRM